MDLICSVIQGEPHWIHKRSRKIHIYSVAFCPNCTCSPWLYAVFSAAPFHIFILYILFSCSHQKIESMLPCPFKSENVDRSRAAQHFNPEVGQ